MGDGRTQNDVVTVPKFIVEFSNLGRIAFSELGGITSKVVSQEYIYNDAHGKTVLTKQFGKTDPPTITLKRGLDADGNARLMAWHAMARSGQPSARASGTLTVMGPDDRPQIQYMIHNGWCSDLQISALKAGDSAVATIECKITCEEIQAIT